MPRIPIASEFYERSAYGLASARMLNMFVEEAFTRERPVVMLPRPGLRRFVEVGQGPIRGIYQRDGVLGGAFIVVSGDTVYSVAADGQVTPRGQVHGTTERVRFSGNLDRLVIVTAPTAWVLKPDTLEQIADPDFNGAVDTDFINGYHLFVRPNTGQVFWSDLLDPSSFSPLEFATAESASDDLVGILIDKQEIYLFGTETTELFSATGNIDDPFRRRPGGQITRGLSGRDAKVLVNNSIFFVGEDRIVYTLNGLSPVRVSKHAIEEVLSKLTDEEAAQLNMWTYTQDGHIFVVLDIPDKHTFCFDVVTRTWHERQSFGEILWEPQNAVRHLGGILTGSRKDGSIYFLDTEADQDNGELIERRFTAGLGIERRGQPIYNLALDVVSGLGSVMGDNPVIGMRWSDDQGHTWSNELLRPLGKHGEYITPLFWTNLGLGRPPIRVFEFTMTDVGRLVVQACRFNEDLI